MSIMRIIFIVLLLPSITFGSELLWTDDFERDTLNGGSIVWIDQYGGNSISTDQHVSGTRSKKSVYPMRCRTDLTGSSTDGHNMPETGRIYIKYYFYIDSAPGVDHADGKHTRIGNSSYPDPQFEFWATGTGWGSSAER